MGIPARRWLVWSLRDLRQRWLLVLAIASVIALGTGMYAALGSTAEWRRESNDASFAALHMHDLRIELSDGAFVPQGSLAAAVGAIPRPGRVTATSERLIVPTQVDASNPGRTILTPGRIVGADLRSGGPAVDGVHVVAGGRPDPATRDVLLESKFADHYRLPPAGTLRVSGNREVRYSGTAMSPEYFLVSAQQGLSFFGEGNFAVLFVPLAAAQSWSGHAGMVNDLVLTAAAGTDVAQLRRDVEASLARSLPGVGVTVSDRGAALSYKFLYDDIKGDQAMWNAVAALIFLGAAFAAFNLVTRIVEAQRRELGVGMALGASGRQLAVRPLLVGIEVAVLGAVGGLLVGLAVSGAFAGLMRDVLPLPIWRTGFQLRPFLVAAGIGFVLPVLATLYPVARAVRSEPVDALATGHLAARARGTGLAPLLRRVRRRGRCLPQLPFRNLLRAPRRTALTALAIGAAIAVMVAVVGIGDSFVRTVDKGADAMTKGGPNRVTVQLDGFTPVSGPVVAGVAHAPPVASADPALQLGGTVSTPGHRPLDVVVELLDFEHARWTPRTNRGRAPDAGEIALTEKAASDLGVRVGDVVTLRHPRAVGPATVAMVDSRVRVSGTTSNPIRPFSYMSMADAARFGLAGATNVLEVEPVPGASAEAVQRAVFPLPGVAAIQPVAATQQLLRDAMKRFVDILQIAEVVVLLLALLIAFNSTSIATEERRREHATMFAFGLPVHRVLRIIATETLAIGVAATGVGIVLGYLLLGWITRSQISNTIPDLAIRPYVAPGTVLTAVALGVLAVTIAPILTVRKLRSMDVPSTLRVLE